ncbi:MAG: hypothetical protein DDT30_00907 [Dehalococcoidia bacterium]|nr:hypothetical protein [Bacillota bacterium]MBT9142339.1 hypothetical protein [Bacillota bacterium]
MASILEVGQQLPLIDRELLRRIGYTNGLSDIWRFARVVEYLYPRIPCALPVLREVIMHEEKAIDGAKYAQGVVDVARALGLLEQVGTKLSLSARGYALHALEQLDLTGESRRVFLLMSVMEFDGECTLNLLDLYTRGHGETADVGNHLMTRLFWIMNAKQEWAEARLYPRFVRDTILGELSKARSKLKGALDTSKKRLNLSRTPIKERILTPDQRVSRFLEHTVIPRRGWLLDLGCMEENKTGFTLTEVGSRLLNALRANGCYRDGCVILPLSQSLSDALQIENFSDGTDLFWRITAMAVGTSADIIRYAHQYLLTRIKEMYQHVKLYGFNETESASVFHVLSAMEALRGQYIPQAEFEQQISELARLFSNEVFLLRQRRGQGGYIALKRGAQEGTASL